MKSFSVLLALGSLNAAVAQVSPWGQCGGTGWTGQTTCVSGYCCVKSNDFYSQCIQGTSCGGASPTTTTRAATTSTARAVTTSAVRTTTTTTKAATTATAANAAATTFCGQWDGLVTTNNYGVYNNLWNMKQATSGSQCTWYNGIVGSGVSWGTSWAWTGSNIEVKSYATAGKLVQPPRLINTISSMPSTFTYTYTVSSGTVANVAYDLFTSSNQTAETWNGEYELMIWVASYGGAGPISATGSPIATVTIAGQSWRLFYGLNGAMKVFSFVYANGVLNSFSGDIKLFYNYLASSQAFPASSQYLLAFQAGTEPFIGSGKLEVSQYTAAVN